MPVCAACGEQNPDKARFCLGCGARLAARQARREERKVVTVLFADLVGFTSRSERMDVEDVRGTLQPYHQLLRHELERFGGTVEKFIGDAVMALFGAPVAHEDDPERAVRAALSIQDAVARVRQEDEWLDLHVRIGVNTGEALIALDAHPSEGEGMAFGDLVNTAARLQSAAPVDGVLVGEVTYRSTNRIVEYEAVEPISAKGKIAPVRVWVARRMRSRLGSDVQQAPTLPLMGREHQLEALWSAFEQGRRERSPRLVTLVGVPGIGKSRLVWELLRRVEDNSALVTWRQGRCLPYGDGVTFWAVGEIVKSHAGILDSDAPEQAREKLHSAIAGVIHDPGDSEWVMHHLRGLVGLGVRLEVSTRDRQGEMFGAWRRFVEAIADQHPLVVVFEDAQWADGAMLDFIEYLVDATHDVPLLLLCTARPEFLERRPDWSSKADSRVISLEPLSDADTASMLATMLQPLVLPAETESEILAHAQGNPLYAEEYVRMLIERGHLVHHARTWRRARVGELPLPESVQGIIAARLDGLSDEQKRGLQAAAVVGKVFWSGAVAHIAGQTASEVEDTLHRLERKHFIHRERESAVQGEAEYAFRHILVRDVTYHQIPRLRRVEVHTKAAQWIDALATGRDDRTEMLAYHYTTALEMARAGRAPTAELEHRARHALRDAARHALGVSAYRAAVRHYQAALALWPEDDPQRPELLFGLGKARFESEIGLPDELGEAATALARTGRLEAAAEAETMIGIRLANVHGDYDQATRRGLLAASLVAERPPSRAKAYALATLASYRLLQAQPDLTQGRMLALEALKTARRLPPAERTDMEAQCQLWIAISLLTGDDPQGFAHLDESLRLAEAAKSEAGLICYANAASILAYLGEPARARVVRSHLVRLARDINAQFWLEFAALEASLDAYQTGDWTKATRTAASQLADKTMPVSDIAHIIQSKVAVARGDYRRADNESQSAVEAARIHSQTGPIEASLANRGRVMVECGGMVEAAAACDKLLARWTRQEGLHPPLVDLALALRGLGRDADLLTITDRVRVRSPVLRAAEAIARKQLLEAAMLLGEVEMRADQAYIRLHAARTLIEQGCLAEGRTAVDQSLNFWRRVGATAYLRDAEALLAAGRVCVAKRS